MINKPEKRIVKLTHIATGKVETKVSYLEMKKMPEGCSAPKPISDLAVVRLKNPSVAFYRFLYDQVGGLWHWTGRKLLDDTQLAISISKPNVEIFVLSFQGNPAGYVEFEVQSEGKDVEIVYFGLIPSFFGRGFGSFLINWSIWYVWTMLRPQRLWVHTCTLDGENALPTYYKAGFTKYDETSELVDVIKPVLEA